MHTQGPPASALGMGRGNQPRALGPGLEGWLEESLVREMTNDRD